MPYCCCRCRVQGGGNTQVFIGWRSRSKNAARNNGNPYTGKKKKEKNRKTQNQNSRISRAALALSTVTCRHWGIGLMAPGSRLTLAKTARFSVFQHHHGTASLASKHNKQKKQTSNPPHQVGEEGTSPVLAPSPRPPPCFPPTERVYMLDTYLMSCGE